MKILFKIYPIDILTNENLDNKTNNLIDKYSFNNQNELFDFLNDGEYECIWHCTSISPMFTDDRYKRKDNLKPCLKRYNTWICKQLSFSCLGNHQDI